MTNEETIQCKSKGCLNPVLDGKYCEFCKQRKKEKRNTLLGGILVGGSVIGPVVVAIKKGAFKNVPKIVGTAIKVIMRR